MCKKKVRILFSPAVFILIFPLIGTYFIYSNFHSLRTMMSNHILLNITNSP